MTDLVVPSWLIVTGSTALAALAGVVLERMFGAGRRAAALEVELSRVQSELTKHRDDTAAHFGKSAELLGRIASDYREYLDHFVSGAETLCEGTVTPITFDGRDRLLQHGSADAAIETTVRPAPEPSLAQPIETAVPPVADHLATSASK